MFYIRILYTIHNGEKDVDDNTDDKDDDYDGQSNGGSFCLWSLVKQYQNVMGTLLSPKFK